MIKHFCDYCEREIEKRTYGNTYEAKLRDPMNTILEANITLSTIVKGVLETLLMKFASTV